MFFMFFETVDDCDLCLLVSKLAKHVTKCYFLCAYKWFNHAQIRRLFTLHAVMRSLNGS